ncbi:tetratricopeptide repeat protein [Rufibacter roseus]|uniref:Tetratricopeptide repeat protein n=2 Tax=Rufibacter roseus TaxID=1567108 RepID=A0ABW2DMZ0_9BACT|nr:hypothetical protein [Rufibacter roseus]
MDIFSFWPRLEPSRRFLYLLLAALLFIALGFGVYGYFKGADTIFPVIKLTELYPAEAQLFPSTHLLTPIHVKANAYLVYEQYALGDMQFPMWGAWLYFIGLAAALAFFWALISTFKRIPYYVGVTLGMLWLATLNLDLIGIFSETSRTVLLVTLAVLVVTSYFFHAFRQYASLFLRFLVNAVLVLVLAAALFYFTPLPVSFTALHVVQHGTLASAVVSLLFMILVSYENLHGLLWFNTQAQNPQRRFGLVQFLMISLLYLGNLLLLYLNQIGSLQFDFAGIDAMLVFLFSAVIGFWGLRQRQVQYARFFRFETEALPLYLLLALLTFLNFGYAALMANDPVVQAYRSAIIFTHLAYGVAFLLYLLVNYAHLIKQRLRVYRVVYDPKRLPYFVVYLVGTVFVIVLFTWSNFSVYYLTKAGHYNYLGDLYRHTEEKPLLAEQYYLEGQVMAWGSQRSTLSLVDMYHQEHMRTLEIQQLSELLRRKPSPEVYLRLANLRTSSSELFDQIKVLQNGIKAYPTYAPLLNNLGLVYSNTTFKDSAAFYLDAALENSQEPEVIQANQLMFLTRHQFYQQAQEFSNKYQGNYGPLLTNRLAVKVITGSSKTVAEAETSTVQDSVLSTQSFAQFYLKHLTVNRSTDTTALVQVERMLKQEENSVFVQDLTILKAFLQQRTGRPTRAKATMEYLAANGGRTSGYYYDVLGQWMLQVQLYPLAADYFEQAAERGFLDAQLHAAIAHALAGNTNRAAQLALDASNISQNNRRKKAGTQLAMVTQLTPDMAANAPDSLKVQFLQIFARSLPVEQLEQVANKITTPELAPVAALPLMERFISEKEFQKASNLLGAHFPASFPENRVKSKAHVLAAELWWKAERYQMLEQQLPTLYFAPEDAGAPHYYRALLAQRNKNTQEATNQFNALVQKAPWSEMGYLAAANFFVNQKKPLRAYDLLLEGIEYNPQSTSLRKAYIRIALNQGFESFGLTALEQLKPMLPPQEYLTFKQEIDAQLQQRQAQQEKWQ